MPVPHSAIGQSDRRVSMPRPRLRLLVVEDETLVAMMLEDMLIELGHHVVGPAGCVVSALKCLADNPVEMGQKTVAKPSVLQRPSPRSLLSHGRPTVKNLFMCPNATGQWLFSNMILRPRPKRN